MSGESLPIKTLVELAKIARQTSAEAEVRANFTTLLQAFVLECIGRAAAIELQEALGGDRDSLPSFDAYIAVAQQRTEPGER